MQEEQLTPDKDSHPLVTLGLLTAGTQVGSSIIQRMAKHPFLLFAMGTGAGIYAYKNRKEILSEAEHLATQGKKLLSK
jgi:hypothetical protein